MNPEVVGQTVILNTEKIENEISFVWRLDWTLITPRYVLIILYNDSYYLAV